MQARAIATAPPGAARPKRAAAPICGSARSARARTTRRSCSTPASPTLNLGVRRARCRRRHLPLDLRRLLPLHEVPRHRLRLRPRAGADGRHGRHPARRRRPAAVRVHATSPTRCRPMCGSCRRCCKDAAGRGARAEPADRRGRVRGGRRSAPAAEAAGRRGRAAGAQLRAARERGRCADRAPRSATRRRSRRARTKLTPEAAQRGQCAADPERAAADRCGRPAAAAVVSASAVRAGLLHGLRGEDDARGARSDRAEGVRRGGGRDRARREGARS